MDAAVLPGFDRVGELDELARGNANVAPIF
jgi:hypothetical protein